MQSFFNKNNFTCRSTGIALTRNVSKLVPNEINGNPVNQVLMDVTEKLFVS